MTDHPFLKLGKAPAEVDVRTLNWGAIVKPNVVVPVEYDIDVTNGRVPIPMFANDRYGCCVISGRGHQTLRFELKEQKTIIPITDKEIVAEYLKESGGQDSGLVVLRSLRAWQAGWKAGGKTYKIKAYAGIKVVQQGASAATSHRQIQEAVYLDTGVGLGVSLPISASKQIDRGQIWDVVAGRTGRAGSWGGHYVFVVGYNKTGPVCVTWGMKQQMTWAFFDAYCDECYAIFDDLNTAKLKRGVKVAEIESYLLDMDAKPVKAKTDWGNAIRHMIGQGSRAKKKAQTKTRRPKRKKRRD